MEQLYNSEKQGNKQSKWISYPSMLCKLFYSYLPMTIYMICLYIISISRESLGVLTVIMVMMLHPVVCYIFGKFFDFLYKIFWHIHQKACKLKPNTPKCLKGSGYLSVIYRSMTLMVLPEHPRVPRKASKNLRFKIFLARLFVMSLNMYISLIGAMMYYLFKQSMAYRESSEFPLVALFDFKEIKFNRCECKPETTQGHCYEVEYNFQNYIAFLPNEAFLLSLFIVPFLMHVLHAALLHLTCPVPMLNFVIGSKYEDEIQESENINEIEMEPMNVTHQESNTNPGDDNLQPESTEEALEPVNDQSGSGEPTDQETVSKDHKTFSKTHWFSLVFGTLILLGIILLPFGFSFLFDKAKEKDGKW